MKPKNLIILSIVFCIIVTTQYFWEQNLGMAAMLSFLATHAFFLIIAMLVAIQLFKLTKQKNRSKIRIASIIIGALVLYTSYLRPYGLIDFQNFEPRTKLEAIRTGGGNCNQHIQLYENGKFVETQRCFSTSTTKGNWKLKNDTIYFADVRKGRGIDKYYEFAVIKESKRSESNTLTQFINKKDSIGHELWINKNELIE